MKNIKSISLVDFYKTKVFFRFILITCSCKIIKKSLDNMNEFIYNQDKRKCKCLHKINI